MFHIRQVVLVKSEEKIWDATRQRGFSPSKEAQKKASPEDMFSLSTSTMRTGAEVPFWLQAMEPGYNLNWKGFSSQASVDLIISQRSAHHTKDRTLDRNPTLTMSDD
jgi:hypothetical protein